MQVAKFVEGVRGVRQIHPGRVREVLTSVAGHRLDVAQGAGRVGGGAWQSLRPEDEQPDHGKDEDLAQADVEHPDRVRRSALGRAVRD